MYILDSEREERIGFVNDVFIFLSTINFLHKTGFLKIAEIVLRTNVSCQDDHVSKRPK